MAKFTPEELYCGDKDDIMGRTAAELLLCGTGDDDQTQVELCLVKHALLAAKRMTQEGDEVVGI